MPLWRGRERRLCSAIELHRRKRFTLGSSSGRTGCCFNSALTVGPKVDRPGWKPAQSCVESTKDGITGPSRHYLPQEHEDTSPLQVPSRLFQIFGVEAFEFLDHEAAVFA